MLCCCWTTLHTDLALRAEAEINRLAIAAKSLKVAVEQANRLLRTDRERAEQILMQALKRAEEDGI
jgi:hypothetical protein